MLVMTANGDRPIVLSTESYEAIRDAMNTREIEDVNFRRVSEVVPGSMSPSELDDLRLQYVDEFLERNPDWNDSVKKLNSRLVFTIGEAACFEGQDTTTAKSAEKFLWRQRRLLSWSFAVMLRRDIRRYTS